MIWIIIPLLVGLDVHAQQGDHAGEEQPPLPAAFERAPSLPLTPSEQLASFSLQPGFRIELVASEPLIEDPVAMSFDPAGRLWVVEMRGYMNDIDGSNETEPIGRIVVLDDLDGDGRMDQSTVFMDHLILPRAIAHARGGILVVEPPHLFHALDHDGDLEVDHVEALATGFGGIENPEHAGNGLVWGMDGWYECSQHPYRYQINQGSSNLGIQRVRPHGQWGVAVDDLGLCWYSPNSEPLLVDFYPKQYSVRNANQIGFHGVGVAAATSRRTRPLVPTPGVNRGYQKNVLDETGRLSTFTGACGTGVYRDDLLGSDVEGDLFVCEVAGNLVKRFDPSYTETSVSCDPVDQEGEFLASSDERFRPVQAVTGPDGALYICDMYRGIIQHRIYMTSFLRAQVVDRLLEKPASLGRIWRVVPDHTTVRPVPDLSTADSAGLLDHLSHSNGSIRDTAQRLIVEREAFELEDDLRSITRDSRVNHHRMRALWTLALLNRIQEEDLQTALDDPDPWVRRSALRIAEEHLDQSRLLGLCLVGSRDSDEAVRVQSALSLGRCGPEQVFDTMSDLLSRDPTSRAMRSAVQSSLSNRELVFMEQISGGELLLDETPTNRILLQDVVDLVLRGRNPLEISRLLAFTAQCPPEREWQLRMVIDRFVSNLKLGTSGARTIRINQPPIGWPELLSRDESSTIRRARMVDDALRWPQRDDHLADAPLEQSVDFKDLQSILAHGKRVYTQCLSCHQADGRGLYPVYPPLADSHFVTGEPSTLAAIILHGIKGRMTVGGRVYNQSMPAPPLTSDEDIAAVMTYVRHAWGNQASPVTPEFVSQVRNSTRDQQGPLDAGSITGTR